MTYLAGLSAKTVVCDRAEISRTHLGESTRQREHDRPILEFFRRWSPRGPESRKLTLMAPVFEVVERPNNWERTVQEQARESHPRASFTEFAEPFGHT